MGKATRSHCKRTRKKCRKLYTTCMYKQQDIIFNPGVDPEAVQWCSCIPPLDVLQKPLLSCGSRAQWVSAADTVHPFFSPAAQFSGRRREGKGKLQQHLSPGIWSHAKAGTQARPYPVAQSLHCPGCKLRAHHAYMIRSKWGTAFHLPHSWIHYCFSP